MPYKAVIYGNFTVREVARVCGGSADYQLRKWLLDRGLPDPITADTVVPDDLAKEYAATLYYELEHGETDKYDACPLREASFTLQEFNELPTMVLGPDDKCLCTKNDRCINVDKKDGVRCSLQDLKKLDREAASRRAWQSGGDY